MSHTRQSTGDPDFPSANEEESHRFECDYSGCPERVEEDGDFHTIWDECRENGWNCYQTPQGQWKHFCPKHAKRRL